MREAFRYTTTGLIFLFLTSLYMGITLLTSAQWFWALEQVFNKTEFCLWSELLKTRVDKPWKCEVGKNPLDTAWTRQPHRPFASLTAMITIHLS